MAHYVQIKHGLNAGDIIKQCVQDYEKMKKGRYTWIVHIGDA